MNRNRLALCLAAFYLISVATITSGIAFALVTPQDWKQENRDMFVPAGQQKTDTRTYSLASSAYADNNYVDPAGSPYEWSQIWTGPPNYQLRVTFKNLGQDQFQAFWTNHFYD
jgi:hypothetical protein